ncbi:MAG: rRNA maturation RNase YbeY [Intestinibacillus sp.]
MAEYEIHIEMDEPVADEASVRELVTRCARETLAREGVCFPAQIDVTVVGDDDIRALNAAYRDKDAVTDVLSFPLYEFYNGEPREDLTGETDPLTGRILLGDMVLNYRRACEQAEEFGHSPARECGFLTVHSVLHLLGYDHERGEAEQAVMRAHEEAVLRALGLTRDAT